VWVSISLVTPAPPAPLPVTATSTDVLANNAAFQLGLVQAGATTAPVTSDYNTLPASAAPVVSTADAFANVPVNTAIDPPWSTASDGITFSSYLNNTGIGISSAPAPNPFGTTLSGLSLDSVDYATPAYADPFAQIGLGVNLSVLG
jgi:hypothetical protein